MFQYPHLQSLRRVVFLHNPSQKVITQNYNFLHAVTSAPPQRDLLLIKRCGVHLPQSIEFVRCPWVITDRESPRDDKLNNHALSWEIQELSLTQNRQEEIRQLRVLCGQNLSRDPLPLDNPDR